MSMDPIELLELCLRGSQQGAPADLVVPRMFNAGDYEAMYRREPKRVRTLLDEILCGAHPRDGLELLLKSGVLTALIPEIQEMKDLEDDPASSLHKDVWEHTKWVVSGVPPEVDLRWAALFHDVGKARTRRVISGKVTFHNHDVVGARMLDRIHSRLDLFQDGSIIFNTIRLLVLNHLRPAAYKKGWGDSGVRRLLADVGPLGFEKLMQLSRADLTTKNPNKRGRALAKGRELEERVKVIHALDNAPRLPKGTMGLILERSGRKPGGWLNEMRTNLEDSMRVGSLPADEDVEFYVAQGLELLQVAEGPC